MYETWHPQKQDLHKNKERPFARSRQVWFAHLGENIGDEQNGKGDSFLRPVVILKEFKHTCYIVPCTTQQKTSPYLFDLGDIHGVRNSALLTQTRVIDKKRLQYKKADISPDIYEQLCQKIATLNLTLPFKEKEGDPKVVCTPNVPGKKKKSTQPPFEVIELPTFVDPRGETIPCEFDESFPFVPKRMYLVTGNDGEVRGGHAHLVEDEVFVAVSGSVTAVLHDGENELEIELNAKNKALVVRVGCWHEFKNFSNDAVMLCLSSTHYFPGEDNYVVDKQTFLEQYT